MTLPKKASKHQQPSGGSRCAALVAFGLIQLLGPHQHVQGLGHALRCLDVQARVQGVGDAVAAETPPLPRWVLTLVLKPFSMLVDSKVERDVRYPEHLDLWSYLYQGHGLGPLLYRLYAVLDHAGRTCHRGHCFCYLQAVGGPCLRKDNAR